jgi:hypothetical protein
MRDSGLTNILCNNELIIAQVVNKEQNLYKSLNITMGDVNVYDIIEAKTNDDNVLEFTAIVEEGVPHKEIFFFKDMEAWTKICIKASENSDQCIIQGLAKPKGTDPGVVAVAYEEGFVPEDAFGESIIKIPEE